jgi:uncharacterized protein with HEPN domain
VGRGDHSEASRRFPDALKTRHPAIDWPGITAVGHMYRHMYDVVDATLVWHTMQYD